MKKRGTVTSVDAGCAHNQFWGNTILSSTFFFSSLPLAIIVPPSFIAVGVVLVLAPVVDELDDLNLFLERQEVHFFCGRLDLLRSFLSRTLRLLVAEQDGQQRGTKR